MILELRMVRRCSPQVCDCVVEIAALRCENTGFRIWVPDNDILGSPLRCEKYWTPDNEILGSPLRYEDLRYATKIKYNTGMQEYYVYILTKKRNGTLYVGMTKDLASRTARHKTGRGSKFVQKYNVDKLVYYEKVKSYREAHSRERQLKWWKRKWKLALIEQMNPEWRDMSKEILGPR